jgi:hypothetical protein
MIWLGDPSVEPLPTGPLGTLRDLALREVRGGLIELYPPLPGGRFRLPGGAGAQLHPCVYVYINTRVQQSDEGVKGGSALRP